MACDPSGTLALLQRFVGPLQPPPGFEGSDAQALLRLARLVARVPLLDCRWVAQSAQTLLRAPPGCTAWCDLSDTGPAARPGLHC